jgi:hypothetical protein
MVGVREKVDCPVKDCKMSQLEGGIDVRGLKAHLMSKHGYSSPQASNAWEQATGRKGRGRPAKKRAIEYVDRALATDAMPRANSTSTADDRQRWFMEGVAWGRKFERG